jgi:hypothetical protein
MASSSALLPYSAPIPWVRTAYGRKTHKNRYPAAERRRENAPPLSTVNHHHHTGVMRMADCRRQVRTAAGHVGHLADGQQPTARRNKRRQEGDVGQAIGSDGQLHDPGAGLLCDHQPGNQVGMVLRFADDDFIAGPQARAKIALRHHIDGFGGAARPDDIFRGRGIQQRRHALAGIFIAFSQALCGGKLATMNVARAEAVKLVAGVDRGERLQRRRRAIKVNAGIGQRRKLGAKVSRIECVHGVPRCNTTIVAQFSHQGKAGERKRGGDSGQRGGRQAKKAPLVAVLH